MGKGLESLKEHFKHLKLPCVEMEYKPVIFSPARDGRLMTKPIAIVVDLGASRAETVTSCSFSIERSDGWLGERTEDGGVSDDEGETVVKI